MAGVIASLTIGAVALLISLVAVAYTRRVAMANERMAREMPESRHGTVLPVLDFVAEPGSGSEMIAEVLRIQEEILPETLHGRLKNIGLGPALDLKFQVKLHDMAPNWQHVGYVGVGECARADLVPSEEWHFYLEPMDDLAKRLSVEYHDVYGRTYRSSRDVIFDPPTGGTTVGLLHTEVSEGG